MNSLASTTTLVVPSPACGDDVQSAQNSVPVSRSLELSATIGIQQREAARTVPGPNAIRVRATGSSTDLGILRLGNVDQALCSGVNDLEGLHDRGTVVGDRYFSLLVHELVHTAGAQGGADNVRNRSARVDVADELRLALGGVGPLLQQDDLRVEPTRPHGHSPHLHLGCVCVAGNRLRGSQRAALV